MAATGYRRITIKPSSPFGPVQDEGLAAATVTPGKLLEITSSGKMQHHSTANGATQGVRVALETIHADAPTTEQIDATYASGDVLYYAAALPGDVYYMFLAGSQTVIKGAYLASDGSGNLQAITPGSATVEGAVVAVAEEDKATATAAVARIKARII
jgi:uncharacterized protein (AIM24 family)